MSDASPTSSPALRRILLVDDEPLNIQALRQALLGQYELFFATDGEQALESAAKLLPDLILLDVVMPGGPDGLQVCQRLKSEPATADIPVIFITGQSSPEEETNGLEAGAVDFISKPVNPSILRARVRTQLTLKTQSDQLREMAFLDGLTGVLNRRRFDELLDHEWRLALRHERPLSILLIDVDHFKKYNDHYGHQAGDGALQAVAQSLKTSMRRHQDILARYGGEEFVSLQPSTPLDDAMATAEYLREQVQALALPHEASPTLDVVTVTIGVATEIPEADRDPAQLLKTADECLYEAKWAGRNRVFARSR